MRTLKVLMSGRVAGDLIQEEDGRLLFRYAPGYDWVPLSVSMPVSNRVYPDKLVRPFLEGLLPENVEVRKRLAAENGVSSRNPFSMLGVIGYDCPGALQFCEEDDVSFLQRQGEQLEPISPHQIAERLKGMRQDANASWLGRDEHWSLGGQQSKFALRWHDESWHRALGDAATTHIFKCGISSLNAQALNEYVCLKTAAACGIPAANVSYQVFEGEPAIVIERFDRRQVGKGRLLRLHQEDFCQILGVLPENKYPQDGGPSTKDVLSVLKKTGDRALGNARGFLLMLFFNYLLAAPDAHAKNYSLLIGPKGEASLAAVLPEKLAFVFDEIEDTDQAKELRVRMEDRIASLCRGFSG